MAQARRNSALAIGLVAALAMAGCGYRFAASGSGLPASAKTIYVAQFANKSIATGYSEQFMRYLKDEIANHHRLRLVDDPAAADLELSGSLIYVTNMPSAFNSVTEPTLYSESMAVNARLYDRRTNKVIWSTRGLGSAQQYAPVAQSVVTTAPSFLRQNLRAGDIANMTDIQVAQTQELAARQQGMKQLAQTLYADMAEGF